MEMKNALEIRACQKLAIEPEIPSGLVSNCNGDGIGSLDANSCEPKLKGQQP